MKERTIFYILGFFAIVKGLLVSLGVNLPRRDGTIIENPLQYSKESILLGAVVIVITFLVTKIKGKK